MSTLLSVCLAMAAGIPAALAAPPIVPQPAAVEGAHTAASVKTQQARALDTARDARRYEAAERAQPKAAEFEGGATVIVLGPAALILGILFLLVLL